MLTFKRELLSDCFDKAAKISGRKTPRDLTQWVLVDASGDRATITATDCETGIRMSCPCEGPALKVLLQGTLVSALLKTMGDEVTLSLEGETAVLSDKVTTFRPPVRDAVEFVGWTTPKESLELNASQFNPAVRRTAFAADVESTRYALGGVLVDIKDGEVGLAATDSRRLAVESFEIDSDAEWRGVISQQAITLAASLMGGTFRLHHDKNAVEFEGADTAFYSRLVEGKFPPYRDVIPKQNSACQVTLACNALMNMVIQAMLVTNEESRGVDFEIRDRLLHCKSAGKGTADINLPVAFDGQAGATLDPRFMRDAFSKFDGEAKVTWGMDSKGANVFTVENVGWKYVVMPLARE